MNISITDISRKYIYLHFAITAVYSSVDASVEFSKISANAVQRITLMTLTPQFELLCGALPPAGVAELRCASRLEVL